ncbi:hypothetical protein NMD36_20420 [Escherichia coli]|uniref:hypothetical protein n=1 Tax=Escherichia coli TaxID=562 RepID=UPI000BE595CC|nr:hypothetical protein [Escherichia coli]EEX1840733.1 hypothetical protein [Escherichia coli]HAX2253053.1 hypothetical protein [Escherichia coli]
MKKVLPILAFSLLSVISSNALANEQSDANLLSNTIFCAMYSTRLTQTGDSGLQIRGVNMNGQVNDAIFEKMINSLKSRYSDAWITQNARQGSMAAMQLSQSDLLYDQSYTNQCNTLINNVHREWGNK